MDKIPPVVSGLQPIISGVGKKIKHSSAFLRKTWTPEKVGHKKTFKTPKNLITFPKKAGPSKTLSPSSPHQKILNSEIFHWPNIYPPKNINLLQMLTPPDMQKVATTRPLVAEIFCDCGRIKTGSRLNLWKISTLCL